jgi:hypothetical protein
MLNDNRLCGETNFWQLKLDVFKAVTKKNAVFWDVKHVRIL